MKSRTLVSLVAVGLVVIAVTEAGLAVSGTFGAKAKATQSLPEPAIVRAAVDAAEPADAASAVPAPEPVIREADAASASPASEETL